jgi:hypothetical protein
VKILILTAHFNPEIHPRAFRADELAREFSSKNHDVTVMTLRTITSFDYAEHERITGIKIIRLNLYNRQNVLYKKKYISSSRLSLFVKRKLRFVIEYLIGGRLFINSIKIKNALDLNNRYDMVIALSTPFMNLLGLALFIRKNKHPNTLYVADSGDPFYRSQQIKRAFYFYFIEKYVYQKFDYLSVPAKASMSAYTGLIEDYKIKIIPQGFNLEKVKLNKPSEHGKIIFAYSGVFYLDIRNPEFLFKTLLKLDVDFRFDIYLRERDASVSKLIKTYQDKLGDKLNIKYGLKREDLIYELSSVDFLINIENKTTNQIPSKLIDYAITRRPIYSCNSQNYNEKDFIKFLNRNYSSSKYIDASKYDIKLIAEEFISLLKSGE